MWRDTPRYFRDQWNALDALGLLCLLIGLVIRWVDSASSWGPAFYALGSPLLVSRVLFFAQVLPFQGPMIQVSFVMLSTATIQFLRRFAATLECGDASWLAFFVTRFSRVEFYTTFETPEACVPLPYPRCSTGGTNNACSPHLYIALNNKIEFSHKLPSERVRTQQPTLHYYFLEKE